MGKRGRFFGRRFGRFRIFSLDLHLLRLFDQEYLNIQRFATQWLKHNRRALKDYKGIVWSGQNAKGRIHYVAAVRFLCFHSTIHLHRT